MRPGFWWLGVFLITFLAVTLPPESEGSPVPTLEISGFTPRWGASAVRLSNGTVVVTGGFSGEDVGTTEIWHPVSRKWIRAASDPKIRTSASAVPLFSWNVMASTRNPLFYPSLAQGGTCEADEYQFELESCCFCLPDQVKFSFSGKRGIHGKTDSGRQ